MATRIHFIGQGLRDGGMEGELIPFSIAPSKPECFPGRFMKFWSRYFIPTLKESPADAEIASHRLLIRAGLVRKIGGGIYTYLPLGLRVMQKLTQMCREEMERAGAIELSMPHL